MKSRTLSLVLVFALLFTACSGSDDDTNTPDPVGDSDTVVNEIPQNVSLRVVDVDGDLGVENDGNVTMSEVVVTSGAGDKVCSFDKISPGDVEECGDASSPVTVTGSGPQGQAVVVEG